MIHRKTENELERRKLKERKKEGGKSKTQRKKDF